MYFHGTWKQWSLGKITHVTSTDLGSKSFWGQWPLVQVPGKKGQCIHIDVFSNLILQWLQKYVIAKAGETRGSRTALFSKVFPFLFHKINPWMGLGDGVQGHNPWWGGEGAGHSFVFEGIQRACIIAQYLNKVLLNFWLIIFKKHTQIPPENEETIFSLIMLKVGMMLIRIHVAVYNIWFL